MFAQPTWPQLTSTSNCKRIFSCVRMPDQVRACRQQERARPAHLESLRDHINPRSDHAISRNLGQTDAKPARRANQSGLTKG